MWLLESALQLADEQILKQPEVQLKGKNKQGQVAEYSWQTQFGVLARSILLSLPDPSPRWFLLPEVRVDTSGNEGMGWARALSFAIVNLCCYACQIWHNFVYRQLIPHAERNILASLYYGSGTVQQPC